MDGHGRTCPSCGSSDWDVNEASGDTVCTACGYVMEQNAIVSKVEFTETAGGVSTISGSYVPATSNKPPALASNGFGISRESRDIAIEKGRRVIQQIASNMRLSQNYVDSAHRMFILAIERNFVQGRTTASVTASCLYIVCRREKSPHMLIDFSDALQVNLFPLGATYVRLCRELNLALPTVDPSLYIHRFAARLDLGESAHAVSMAALRIVSRMRRDWMVSGRRPAGVCGAALLVAARVHGHRRTRAQILRALRIDDSTLQDRLAEFEATPAASLTPQDFERLDAADGALGSVASSAERPTGFEADPPSFVRGRILDDINIRRHLLLEQGTPKALHELQHGDALSSGAISADTLKLIDEARVLPPMELARKALERGYLQVDDGGTRVFLPGSPDTPLLKDGPAEGKGVDSASTAVVLHAREQDGDRHAIAPLHPSIVKAGKGLVPKEYPQVPPDTLQSLEYRCVLARVSADPRALQAAARIIPQNVARGLVAETLLSKRWGSKRGKPLALRRNAQAAARRLAAHEEQLNRLRTRLLRRRVARRQRRRRWEQLHTPSVARQMLCPTGGMGVTVHADDSDSASEGGFEGVQGGSPPPLPTIMSLPWPDTDSEAEWLYNEHLVVADAVKPPVPPPAPLAGGGSAGSAGRAGAASRTNGGVVTVQDVYEADAAQGWADGDSDVFAGGFLTDEALQSMSGGDTEDEEAEEGLPLCEGGSPLHPSDDAPPGAPADKGLPRHEWPGPLDSHTEASVREMLATARAMRQAHRQALVSHGAGGAQQHATRSTAPHTEQSLMQLVDTDTDSEGGSDGESAPPLQGDTAGGTEEGSVADLYARLAQNLSQRMGDSTPSKGSPGAGASASSTAIVPHSGSGSAGGGRTDLLTPLPSHLAGMRGEIVRVDEERSEQLREWANEDFTPPPEIHVPLAEAEEEGGGTAPSTPPSADEAPSAPSSTALVPLAPPAQLAQWDAELASYMLPPAAAAARSVVWRRLHGEYMDDLQQRLREGKVVPRKRRRRAAGGPGADAQKLEGASAAEAVEAMLAARSTSKKVNYSALENLDALFAAAGDGGDDGAAADYHDALGMEEEAEGGVTDPQGGGRGGGTSGGNEAGLPSPSHRRRPAAGEGGLRKAGGGLPMGQFGKRPRAPSVSHVVGSDDEADGGDSDVGDVSPGAVRQLKRSSAAAVDVGAQRGGGGAEGMGSLSAAILGGGAFADDSDDEDDE